MTHVGEMDRGKTTSTPLRLSSWLFIGLKKLLISSRMESLAGLETRIWVNTLDMQKYK